MVTKMNGIAFSDQNENLVMETIGGHHWIARRVPDDAYVVMPNQLGIDAFDLDDAFTMQENHMCSSDMREFIANNHLNSFHAWHFFLTKLFGNHDALQIMCTIQPVVRGI